MLNSNKMPAKSISWKWPKSLKEDEALEADVFYNGVKRGEIEADINGVFNGFLETSVLKDGKLLTFSVETKDGYEKIGDCGRQLFKMFARKVHAAGMSF